VIHVVEDDDVDDDEYDSAHYPALEFDPELSNDMSLPFPDLPAVPNSSASPASASAATAMMMMLHMNHQHPPHQGRESPPLAELDMLANTAVVPPLGDNSGIHDIVASSSSSSSASQQQQQQAASAQGFLFDEPAITNQWSQFQDDHYNAQFTAALQQHEQQSSSPSHHHQHHHLQQHESPEFDLYFNTDDTPSSPASSLGSYTTVDTDASGFDWSFVQDDNKREKIKRWKAKKVKIATGESKAKQYTKRKKYAQIRPRLNGRFVTQQEFEQRQQVHEDDEPQEQFSNTTPLDDESLLPSSASEANSSRGSNSTEYTIVMASTF